MKPESHHDPAFLLYVWPYRALYVGVSPENALHEHHAAQLCISLDGSLRARDATGAPWLQDRAILIPPDLPHEIDAGAGHLLALYWEPESRDYPFTAFGSVVRPFPMTSDSLSALTSLSVDSPEPADAWARCASALHLTARRSSKTLEPRVADTLKRVRRAPSHAHTLRSLATQVHLSPSRLSHLFAEQVGVSLRRFIVWMRVRLVVRHALEGSSLTEAAHASGFSDAAHLSHAFRRMFGFAPSVLFAPRIPKRVFLVDEE